MHRERDEPHPDLGVVALHGLHQADVTFLNQIAVRQPVPGVAARQVHDESQMAQHQLARGLEVVLVVEPLRQRLLFFGGQDREATHRLDVRIQIPARRETVESQ